MSISDRLDRIEAQIQTVIQFLSSHADELITLEGVQELTSLSKSAIYQKTCSINGQAPELPHFKRGKRLYFKRSEIVQWMMEKRVRNREEVAAEARSYCATTQARTW